MEGPQKPKERFLHVKDAVKASEKILKNKFVNTRVLITGSKKIKIKNLILQIKKILKINKKFYLRENQCWDITIKTRSMTNPKNN